MSDLLRGPTRAIVKWALTAIIVGWSAFPIFYMVLGSFKPPADVWAYPPRIFGPVTGQNYAEILRFNPTYIHDMWNSVQVTVYGVLLTLLVALAAAFVFARLRFGWLRVPAFFIITVRMFPPIVVIIPLFPLMSALGLLDTLGVTRTHLVGNSMGGMVALLLVQEQPDRIDRVILMGSAGAPIEPTADLIKMITYYDDPSPEAMLDLMGRFLHDPGLYGDRIDEIAADRAEVAAREDIRRSHLRTFSPDGPLLVFPVEALTAIEHEVLLVHGREDRIIRKESSHYLADLIPNAQLHVLPHAGHWVQIEQADRFRALATGFLSEDVA